MACNVKYEADGRNAIWPIPFEHQGPGSIGVRLVDPLGNERELVQGTDYYIQDNKVICAAPAGYLVLILLCGRLPAFAPAQSAAAPAYAPPAMPAAAPPGNDSNAELLARVETLTNQMNCLLMDRLAQPAAAAASPQAEALPAYDPALADMEKRLASIEADKEAALAAARAAEADGQIQSIRASGEESRAMVESAADAAADNAAKTISAQAEDAAKALDQTAGNAQSLAGEALQKAEAAEAAAQAALAEVQSALAELRQTAEASAREVELAAKAASGGFEAQKEKSIREVREAGHCAMEQARHNCELPGHAWPRGAVITQPFDLAAGAAMDLPLLYYPGRDSLLITRNGDSLAPGIDYEEIRPHHGHESHSIRLLKASNACAVWTFWIPPTNASQAADLSAKDARHFADLARDNARMSRRCAESARHWHDQVSRSGAELRTAAREGLGAVHNERVKGLADVKKEAGRGLRDIKEAEAKGQRLISALARCAEHAANQAKAYNHSAFADATAAWEAAWQASIAAARPGIAAIRDLSQISKCVSGIYIINPNLAHSPTPFMGIWPVPSKAHIAWDGIFFIGLPYSEDPILPPKPPAPPDPEPCPPQPPKEAQGQWLPCDHNHGDANVEE